MLTKKKKLKNIPAGMAHIHSTFNNTIVAITDVDGKVIAWKIRIARLLVSKSKKELHFAQIAPWDNCSNSNGKWNEKSRS